MFQIPNSEHEWQIIAKAFEEKWQFPHCLGAIDGKHIEITAPANSGSVFYNYKEYNSIILLAVVDAHYRFIWYDLGRNGRQNDAGVYAESSIRAALEDNTVNVPSPVPLRQDSEVRVPYFLVGDEAFPLKSSLMKPFPQRGLTDPERIFNYRLSRARRVAENAFGILANRFRVLTHAINLDPDVATDVTECCLALHNFLRTERDALYNQVPEKALAGSIWRNDRPLLYRGNNSAEDARRIRNELKDYFCTVGQVPFQWSHVE